MHVSDDLYLGGFFGTQGLNLFKTGAGNPTQQEGVGPMGRIIFTNIVPATIATANIAALQALTASTAMTLAAGAGITVGTAPDGSGNTVYTLDTPRCISLTSTSNLSGLNVLLTGYDIYGQKMTQLLSGPNNTTVNTTKAFSSLLSAVPTATNAGTMSIGTSDIFGLPYYMADAGYIVSAKWANTLAQNAGTFVAGVTTAATSSTGDVRGTFAQAGAASNGANRLVIAMHLTASQCGSQPSIQNLIGVPQA